MMKLHQILLSMTVCLLIITQHVSANSDDSDYDDGVELQNIHNSENEYDEPPQVKAEDHPAQIKVEDHPKKKQPLAPHDDLKKVEKKLSMTAYGYIPIGIIAAVAINVVAISVVMMMRKRRAQVVYSKMNVAKEEVAFELKETEMKV